MGTEGTLHALASGRAHGLAGIETTRCRYSVPITECGMEVIPLPTSHDAAEPCGFFIRDEDLSLTFYTDTGRYSLLQRVQWRYRMHLSWRATTAR